MTPLPARGLPGGQRVMGIADVTEMIIRMARPATRAEPPARLCAYNRPQGGTMMNWLPTMGLALAVAAPGPKEGPKKADPPSLVGEWQCLEFIGGGQAAAPKDVAECSIEFTADGKVRNRWGKDVTEGTYTADPAKDPAHLDVVSDKNGKVGRMIYKVEKDKLV